MRELRGTIITSIITTLKGTKQFNLVKPYHGELDRYRKQTQIKEQTFPAEVNLQTPFALVISKDREVDGPKGNSIKLRHNISIYVGTANPHDFSSEALPESYGLLEACVDALRPIRGLTLVNEGLYLAKTDLFIVYDQQWFIHEIAY